MSRSLSLSINGVLFKETDYPIFSVSMFGEEDPFPFLSSSLVFHTISRIGDEYLSITRREYRSILIDGRYYAPDITPEDNMNRRNEDSIEEKPKKEVGTHVFTKLDFKYLALILKIIYWVLIAGIVTFISYLYYQDNMLTFELIFSLSIFWGGFAWLFNVMWLDDFIWSYYDKWNNRKKTRGIL